MCTVILAHSYLYPQINIAAHTLRRSVYTCTDASPFTIPLRAVYISADDGANGQCAKGHRVPHKFCQLLIYLFYFLFLGLFFVF